MERFIFKHEEWERMYNCDLIDVNSIPIAERRHIVAGITLVLMTIVLELLYLPCLIVISRHTQHPCYRIMLFIGIFDCCSMLFTGIYTGLGLSSGFVFCSNPTLIYLAGVAGTSLWAVVSLSSLILAANRCVEVISSYWGRKLFEGQKVKLWLVAPCLYGLFVVWTANPGLLNSIYTAWMFHPHVGYLRNSNNEFVQPVHYLNNAFVTICLPLLYLMFGISLSIQRSFLKRLNSTDERNSLIDKYSTFVQVLLISLLNVVVSILYIYIQYANSPVLFLLATFSWLGVHGFPAIIYLSLNRVIRSGAWKLIKSSFFISHTSMTVSMATTSSQPQSTKQIEYSMNPVVFSVSLVVAGQPSTIAVPPLLHPNRLPALER
ncbi:hypothetical protein M3Y98_00020200 [Aphelenchoides besseyi]|nr:hypothetical protein M3Y98_00020200 [Aphelenchoides besseyi]